MYFYVQKARLEIIDFEMTLGRKIFKKLRRLLLSIQQHKNL